MKRIGLRILLVMMLVFMCMPLAGTRVQAAAGIRPEITIEKDLAGKVKLTWGKVKNADKYTVFRATKRDGLYKKLAVRKKCSYTDRQTDERKEYYYRVWAESRKYDKEGRLSDLVQRASKIQEVYARPQNARVILLGECYAEGINLWAKQLLGPGDTVYGKEGVSSSGLLTLNCVPYKGQTITMLDWACYQKPDRVYMLIGMNECASGNVQGTISNFQQAHDQLKRINPNVDLVLMPVTPTGRTSSLNIPSLGQRLNWNAALQKYAMIKEHVFYYDYTPLLDDGQGYIQSRYGGGDGCHWNSAATRLVTEKWLSWDHQTFLN